MKTLSFGKSKISDKGPCYVIAELGHNHQGNLETACKMIQIAAGYGVQAVKLQKRDNKSLYTKAFYNKPYDNENSYGATYGDHREFLEFNMEQFKVLKKCAEDNGVEFMSTAFDLKSVDFLEELEINSYKIASADVTNTPLLKYIAKIGKPMIVSTGAATLEEIKIAYNAIRQYNNKLCLLHCIAGYPTEYHNLNLKVIATLQKEFPDAIIGYSGHDNGILAPVIAYMLGATVVEKHFTLNRSWKGTDHRFSLEPEGLRKMIRDLRRVDIAMGDGHRVIYDFEIEPRKKMGKGIYASKSLRAGSIITWDDVSLKTPTNGVPAYMVEKMIGKKLKVDVDEEATLSFEILE